MPDCYLCGAYIERGRGYRRNVQTETSTRVYITRHGGGSLGSRHALRTVCRSCAKVHDRLAKGGGLRTIFYAVGYGFSLWLGWRILFFGSEHGGWINWFGLACLLGIPVLMIGSVLGAIRRFLIVNGRMGAEPRPAFDPALAFKQGEAVDTWLDRILPVMADTEETRRYLIACARQYPPRVGQLPGHWFQSIPEEGPRASPTRASAQSADPQNHLFRSDDTLSSWVDRVSSDMVVKSGADYDEFHNHLMELAEYAYPHVGESARLFSARAYNIARPSS